MKSKEEVIKDAYGKHWDEVWQFIDDNGWCTQLDYSKTASERRNHRTLSEMGFKEDDGLLDTGYSTVTNCHIWRPKSLQGIETNNGWISINSEKDLPSDSEVCHFVPCGFFDQQFIGFIKDDEVYFVDEYLRVDQNEEQDSLYLNSWLKCQITHYQLIVKPLAPLHK